MCNQVSFDPRSYERNLLRIEARKSQDFKYRCDALTNLAMKPLTLGAGHL